ncbi:hypothetical protein BR93DRAFT_73419 [Coniochaeta sp. PMI_546]|nr:hypothetical protein BR93DRAFT_73419 [Coniochaeta sp. PMI_546]
MSFYLGKVDRLLRVFSVATVGRRWRILHLPLLSWCWGFTPGMIDISYDRLAAFVLVNSGHISPDILINFPVSASDWTDWHHGGFLPEVSSELRGRLLQPSPRSGTEQENSRHTAWNHSFACSLAQLSNSLTGVIGTLLEKACRARRSSFAIKKDEGKGHYRDTRKCTHAWVPAKRTRRAERELGRREETGTDGNTRWRSVLDNISMPNAHRFIWWSIVISKTVSGICHPCGFFSARTTTRNDT